MKGVPSQVIAAGFALSAFTVATLSGLAAGNNALPVLARAIGAMLLCYPVGWTVGAICQRILNDHLERFRAANPVRESQLTSPSPAAPSEEEIIIV